MKKLFALIIGCLFSFSVLAQNLVIISSVPNLTKVAAIDIYTFQEYTFPNGQKINMFMLPRDSLTTRMFSRELGLTSIRFYEKAETAFASGKLNMLTVVGSETEVINQILKTNGAIGYAKEYMLYNDAVPSIIKLGTGK